MVLWGMFFKSFLIGFSGAMVPGTMLGVTIDGSLKKGWKAGPLIVLGHGILEILLIIVIALYQIVNVHRKRNQNDENVSGDENE